jgi:hypothetical protein
VSATGWGKTETVDTYQRSAVLMRVDLQVMDTKRCAVLPGYGPQKIHGGVICAANVPAGPLAQGTVAEPSRRPTAHRRSSAS